MEWKKLVIVVAWLLALFLLIKSGPLFFGGKETPPALEPTTTTSILTTTTSKPMSILARAVIEGKSSVGMKILEQSTHPRPTIVKKKPLVTQRKIPVTKSTPTTIITTSSLPTSIPTWELFVCDEIRYDSYPPEYERGPNIPYEQQYWKEITDLDRHNKFWISTNNPRTDRYISGTIHNGKFWEPDIVAQIRRRITNRQQVFVDVGANIGYFSALAARRGRVYSFEAVWSNYARMELTKERNNFKTWKMYHSAADAVSDQSVRLGMASRSVNSGNFKIGRGGRERSITTRVDDHVHEHVDLMKIDVEGYEARVIMGSTTLICHYGVNAIIMEFTNDLKNAPGCRWMELFQWLNRIGYVLKNMRENVMYLHWRGLGWKPQGANVAFVLRPGLNRAKCS